MAAVAASGAAIGHGSGGASSGQGGMMGGGQGDMGLGMMGGGQGGMASGMIGGGMRPCPMMGGAGMGAMHETLDPEQRDEMRNLMQEHRPAHFERMGRMMNLRDDLMAEMQQLRPDPEEAKKRAHGRASRRDDGRDGAHA